MGGPLPRLPLPLFASLDSRILLASGTYASPRELKNLPCSQSSSGSSGPCGLSPKVTLGSWQNHYCLQSGPRVFSRTYILGHAALLLSEASKGYVKPWVSTPRVRRPWRGSL